MNISCVFPDGGRVSLAAEGNVVTIRGEIDQSSPKEFLAPFFDQIHSAVDTEGLREVKVDIRGLTFLNSAAVKELIAWVLRRNRLAPEKKYKLDFIYDTTILWQRVTMPTLSQLDPEFVLLSDRSAIPKRTR
jgi:hypothetical protein